jgi:hypothetical protein
MTRKEYGGYIRDQGEPIPDHDRNVDKGSGWQSVARSGERNSDGAGERFQSQNRETFADDMRSDPRGPIPGDRPGVDQARLASEAPGTVGLREAYAASAETVGREEYADQARTEFGAEADVQPAGAEQLMIGAVRGYGSIPPEAPEEQDVRLERQEPGAAWLDGPDRPDLASTRPYDQDGGLVHPDPVHQRELEDAVPGQEDGIPERFPEPRQRWPELINDGGPSADPTRANNCLDCSLSLISTWHGQPEVAAPRFPDHKQDGSLDTWLGEANGPERAEEWLGQKYEYLGGPDGAQREIARRLDAGGHGSSAAIITAWKEGGSHAWNAMNYHGDILWVDSQVGRVDAGPLYATEDIDRVWAITMDREGKKL